MKKYFILLHALIFSITLYAQEKIYIHKSDKISLGVLINQTDSIYFNDDDSKVFFIIGTQFAEYAVSEIDSISFGDNSKTISVTYTGSSVSVINPLAFEGVTVSVTGAKVSVQSTSEDTEINYDLKGTTTDGMFKIFSSSKFNLQLNGLNMTNTDGPAVNIQSSKKCTISLENGTTNSLTDGSTYATYAKDEKSTLFSEGQIDFVGTGSLTVKSNSAHAICSDDYIHILSGDITVSGATKDGIHVNDYFKMSGGTLNVTSSGDGVDCENGYILISGGNLTSVNNSADAKGLVCDSILTITGGTIKLSLEGTQSKGIKATQKIVLGGGDITINNSGGAFLQTSGSGFDPAYSCGIKSDDEIEVSGSNITIASSGAGGKGISATGNLTIYSGIVNVTTSGAGAKYTNTTGIIDSYSAIGLNSDGNINIAGGEVTISSSGLGGKGIKANGTITVGNVNSSPILTLTTTGAKFLVSGTDYSHPKTILSDGTITISNGSLNISSTDDAIHSETSIIVEGGNTIISKSNEGIESFYVYMKGGTLDVTSTNDGINTTKGIYAGGTGSNDGSCLYISGGTMKVNCTNGDAIDSNGNIEVSGGITIVNGPPNGPEEAVDFNGTFKMTGGLFIGAGSDSKMTRAMSAISTQPNMYIISSAQILSNTFLHIQNANGTDILTFKSRYGGYKFLFSSSTLSKGSTYSIYIGGTYSGGNSNNGLYTGGTWSGTGATLKKTVTMSISSTVNQISF